MSIYNIGPYDDDIPLAPAVEVTGDPNNVPYPIQPMAPPTVPLQQQSMAPPPTVPLQQQQQQQQPLYVPPIDDIQLSRLREQGYTRGLTRSLEDSRKEFALKIWIVDNSGSMQQPDGNRMVGTKSHPKMIDCTRWEEIQDCINYHIDLSDSIQSKTHFRLLNHPGGIVGKQRFTVGDRIYQQQQQQPSSQNFSVTAQDAKRIMYKVRPGGCTPLTYHLLDIHHEISTMMPMLQQTGQRVALIIATDGLPTDERGYGGANFQDEFTQALRLFERLPVWVVIRLCTDDEGVVDFYNELDNNLELSLEVLDDFVGEAQEVRETNPWLTYSLLLHRLRESGFHDRVFDLLDERLLTRNELRDFCFLLFGEANFDGVPDPNVDWDGFVKDIEKMCYGEEKQWDPITKTMRPWIDTRELNRSYGEGSGCVCM